MSVALVFVIVVLGVLVWHLVKFIIFIIRQFYNGRKN